jgi:hypothetical protein
MLEERQEREREFSNLYKPAHKLDQLAEEHRRNNCKYRMRQQKVIAGNWGEFVADLMVVFNELKGVESESWMIEYWDMC